MEGEPRIIRRSIVMAGGGRASRHKALDFPLIPIDPLPNEGRVAGI